MSKAEDSVKGQSERCRHWNHCDLQCFSKEIETLKKPNRIACRPFLPARERMVRERLKSKRDLSQCSNLLQANWREEARSRDFFPGECVGPTESLPTLMGLWPRSWGGGKLPHALQAQCLPLCAKQGSSCAGGKVPEVPLGARLLKIGSSSASPWTTPKREERRDLRAGV